MRLRHGPRKQDGDNGKQAHGVNIDRAKASRPMMASDCREASLDRRHLILLFALLACVAQARGQQSEPTQIFLAPFVEGPPRTVRVALLTFQSNGVDVGKPVVNLTSHKRDDDEPAFLPDSSGFLFASNRDGSQWDIFKYDIASKAVVQLTRTSEDEREPVAAPDGKTFTAFRAAERRAWRFNLDGSDAGPAGPLGSPANSPCASSARVAAVSEGTKEIRGGGCTPEGRLVTGDRSKLRFWEDETDRWVPIADLKKARVRQITRVAVSPDGRWIAIVSRATK